MRGSSALVLVIAIGCTHSVDEPKFAVGAELGTRHVVHGGPEEPDNVRTPSDRAEVRYRMQQQFDDLRNVESLLVAGRLADARTLAFMLSRPIHHPAMAQWSAESARLSAAALALSRAASIDEAYRHEASVASACAACHARAGARLAFEARSGPPPDGVTPHARRARHRWAADRVARGLIAGSDRSWRAGLEVFAASQFASPGDPSARRFKALARAALDNRAEATMPERVKTYGKLLVTCSGCHPATRS